LGLQLILETMANKTTVPIVATVLCTTLSIQHPTLSYGTNPA
jgi:hypothetical protein